MSERLTDEEYRAWIDAGSPNELEGWATVLALRARVAQLEALLTEQEDHWRWIIKAYPNSGASATAERAIAALKDAPQ